VRLGHGRLLKMEYPGIKKAEIQANFDEKVKPSFKIPLYVGNTYSSTVYACFMGLLDTDKTLKAGDRIGFYSYGSGSCAEFYSGILLPGAFEAVKNIQIDEMLKSRYPLTVEEFDTVAKKHMARTEKADFETDLNYPAGWYDKYYKGKGKLILKGAKGYIRKYEWS
jgi:3-hydroxy-3-methylglutaryl CoA synthase